MDKVFFKKGDVVRLKANLSNMPARMMVESIDKSTTAINDSHVPQLFGITCFWFKTDGSLAYKRFNSKDLIKCD